MLSKSVCLLNEEPPSTSSLSNHFELNHVEMSNGCREQKGLTHRALYAARPSQRFNVRSGSLSIHPPLQARVKHIGNSVSLIQTYTKLPCCHNFVFKNVRECLLYLQKFLQGLSFFLLLFHHPFTTQGQALHKNSPYVMITVCVLEL